MDFVQRLRAFTLGSIVIALSFGLFFLSACSGYGAVDTTPTSAALVQQPSTTTAPVVNTVTTSKTTTAGNAEAAKIAEAARTVGAAGAQAGAVPTLAPAANFYKLDYANSEYFIHIPPHLKVGQPLQVVVAVHGMGGNGRDFATPLLSYADEYGLVLVAPTMKYDTNYADPARIAANDALLLPQLEGLLNSLSARLSYPVADKVFLFGFSRGGQIVHRFATFYPERVRGVAAMSAGNYTLPANDFQEANKASKVSLPFPYGVADLNRYTGGALNMEALRRVNFWLGVGGSDVATGDVPTAWSPYLGNTRVERATRYHRALQDAGIQVTLKVFPGVGHSVCTEMKQEAFAFFNGLASEK